MPKDQRTVSEKARDVIKQVIVDSNQLGVSETEAGNLAVIILVALKKNKIVPRTDSD